MVAFVVILFSRLNSARPGKPVASPRARDLGVPFDGTPGPLNAITDIPALPSATTTLIPSKKTQIARVPIRTGVTSLAPTRKEIDSNPVFAGWWSPHGNGEMTGTTWVKNPAFWRPVMDHQHATDVGVVRDRSFSGVWRTPPDPPGYWFSLPVGAETWDGWLNDIGFHFQPEHASRHRLRNRAPRRGMWVAVRNYRNDSRAASHVLAQINLAGSFRVGVLCNAVWHAPQSCASPAFLGK